MSILNNKQIIDSLSEYYDIEIDTDAQAKSLFDRFVKERVEFDGEVLPLKLDSDTHSISQIIKNCTKLFSVARNGTLKEVKDLIEAIGISVNIKDRNGKNAFMLAAENGKLDVVKYLIETAEADVSVIGNDGKNAFMLVAENGKLDVVKYLVETAKVDVNKHFYSTNALLIFITICGFHS